MNTQNKKCNKYSTKGLLKMRRLLVVLLVFCIALSTAACTGDGTQPQKESNETNTVANTSSKDENEIFGLNDTAVFKNLKVTATKLEESQGSDFFNAESGKIFVGVNFEIENISEETQNISSLLLFDAYADDVKCDYSISANVVFGDGTLDGELSPGKKLVGWYALEVPEGWQQIELEVKSSWLSGSKARFVFDK